MSKGFFDDENINSQTSLSTSTPQPTPKTKKQTQRLPHRRGPQPADPLLARPGPVLRRGVRGALRPAGREGFCAELSRDDRAGVLEGERRRRRRRRYRRAPAGL